MDCEFAKHCGGGHTTDQHHIHVYERIIKQECGVGAYFALKEAVDLAAGIQKIDNLEAI
jgi:hypothetical protein